MYSPKLIGVSPTTSAPPDVARDLPRVAQGLLGYAVHDAIADLGGYLGMLDLRDPVDLFEEGKL